jgi:hypothetical protein
VTKRRLEETIGDAGVELSSGGRRSPSIAYSGAIDEQEVYRLLVNALDSVNSSCRRKRMRSRSNAVSLLHLTSLACLFSAVSLLAQDRAAESRRRFSEQGRSAS